METKSNMEEYAYVIIGKDEDGENVLALVKDEEQLKLGIAYFKETQKYNYWDIDYERMRFREFPVLKHYYRCEYDLSLTPVDGKEGEYYFTIFNVYSSEFYLKPDETFSPISRMTLTKTAVNDGDEAINLKGYFTQDKKPPASTGYISIWSNLIMDKVNAESSKIKLVLPEYDCEWEKEAD